jgi:hypothetical protein
MRSGGLYLALEAAFIISQLRKEDIAMSGQQAFFTSDTALVRTPRLVAPEVSREPEQSDTPRKTLAERLVAAWLAPWTHGFTPLW